MAVAIVGMACGFPGARSLQEYWSNLLAGRCAIGSFSDAELLTRGVSRELLRNPSYVKAGAVLDDIDRFDAGFFGYTPREAQIDGSADPPLLECAWHALEDAGCDPLSRAGVGGVFAGSAASTYLSQTPLAPPSVPTDPMMTLQAGLFNSQDTLAPAIAYKLNLRGPSISVQTFCSTSLVAVHMACQEPSQLRVRPGAGRGRGDHRAPRRRLHLSGRRDRVAGRSLPQL